MAARISEVRKLDSAEALLAELSPATGALWRGVHELDPAGAWIFRGQANHEDGTIWSSTHPRFVVHRH
jgi:hypothetical protein